MTIKELSQLYYLTREIEMDTLRLKNLDQAMKADEDLLRELRNEAESPSTQRYDGMPKNPNCTNKMEKSVTRILDMEDIIRKKKVIRNELDLAIHAKQLLCIAERAKLERYIAEISDSLVRMIMTYRFVDGLTWEKVSDCIDRFRTTPDSVKKLCYRYIEKN